VQIQTTSGVEDLDDDGWRSEGWVLVGGPLSQTYAVRLIGEAPDGTPVVLDVPLDEEQRGELRFDGALVADPVLAVAGTTEGTRRVAPYTFSVSPWPAPGPPE
jgi:hypothetical protein